MTRNRTILLVLSFVAFVSLGLPDGLLGVAWPGIRDTFGLPVDALGLFLVFTTAGYMTSGLSLTGRWQPGYQVVAVAQLLLAAGFFTTRRLWERERAVAPIGPLPPGGSEPVADDDAGGERSEPHPTAPEREATIWQSAAHLRSLESSPADTGRVSPWAVFWPACSVRGLDCGG